ncbi:MAG: glycosyltransferase family protein [Gammaproteobacteria bacterium]|nr:glycosyltransferase family protein [Gammaproteobacteria bacterium]
MKIVATIEARMTSTRLPGKVMMPVLGKPILHYLVERLKSVPSIDEIVLATTLNKTDDKLIEFAISEDISYFRGSEDDVMLRVIEAADSVSADIVVEITGDCPIIDPQIVEQTILMYRANNVDYVSNGHIRSFPDGMDTQVFALDVLKKSLSMTTELLDHEHVTLHIRNNPQLFTKINFVAPPELDWPDLGLTLDERHDYNLLKIIIEHFSQEGMLFSCLDVIKFLRSRPDLVAINKNVHRKGDS